MLEREGQRCWRLVGLVELKYATIGLMAEVGIPIFLMIKEVSCSPNRLVTPKRSRLGLESMRKARFGTQVAPNHPLTRAQKGQRQAQLEGRSQIIFNWAKAQSPTSELYKIKLCWRWSKKTCAPSLHSRESIHQPEDEINNSVNSQQSTRPPSSAASASQCSKLQPCPKCKASNTSNKASTALLKD